MIHRPRRLGMAALLCLTLISCAPAAPEMPPDPPGIVDVARRPWGDTISIVDSRAWFDVQDGLKAEAGDRKVRWRPLALDAAVEPEAIREHYQRELGRNGWSPLPLHPDPFKESWSYAWRSEASGDVFAVVGLTPKRAVAGMVPFNILTTLAEKRG